IPTRVSCPARPITTRGRPPSDASNATKGKGFRTYQKTFVTKYEFPTAAGLMPPSRRIVDAVHSENIQCRCLVLGRSGFRSRGITMTRTLGLIITLFALAVGGLVAAQNSTPSTQNAAAPAPGAQSAAAPAPSAAPAPAPGPQAGPPPAGGGQKRIALVVGNSAYQAAPLKTAANDAGLIAQTLQAAGFDVVGARDLDQESMPLPRPDFLDKAQASGPDTAAFIYLSGYGVQYEGENYFVPIDAKLARAADVPVETVRMSDYTRPLAGMNLKVDMVVLDAGRANPFAKSG